MSTFSYTVNDDHKGHITFDILISCVCGKEGTFEEVVPDDIMLCGNCRVKYKIDSVFPTFSVAVRLRKKFEEMASEYWHYPLKLEGVGKGEIEEDGK